jgi:hypothetical protein
MVVIACLSEDKYDLTSMAPVANLYLCSGEHRPIATACDAVLCTGRITQAEGYPGLSGRPIL